MIQGDAIKELSDRLHHPEQHGDVIVAPANWQFKHQHELAKPAPAFPTPACKVLQVSTLGALRDYLAANRDGLDLATLLVHIQTPHCVTVSSALRAPARDREVYITASAEDMTTCFVGKWHAPDAFNIGLQVRFLPPVSELDELNQRNELLQMVSAIRTEQSTDATDDGLSQSLEARAGVVMKSHQRLPNPVQLTPWRTFRDVLQPSSPFVLRVKAEAGEMPELCLFEADGGMWKLVAISRIHDWLTEHLPAGVAVLA